MRHLHGTWVVLIARLSSLTSFWLSWLYLLNDLGASFFFLFFLGGSLQFLHAEAYQ